jgi:hypothetical protein
MCMYSPGTHGASNGEGARERGNRHPSIHLQWFDAVVHHTNSPVEHAHQMTVVQNNNKSRQALRQHILGMQMAEAFPMTKDDTSLSLQRIMENEFQNGVGTNLVVSPSSLVRLDPSDRTATKNWYKHMDASMATLRPVHHKQCRAQETTKRRGEGARKDARIHTWEGSVDGCKCRSIHRREDGGVTCDWQHKGNGGRAEVGIV